MWDFFRKKGQDKAPPVAPSVDIGRACAVLQQFPIGSAVRYYPEFKKDIVLESVILGYLCNKTLVFASQDMRCEGGGAEARLSIGPHHKHVTRLTGFGIIIPAQSRGVEQLDYARKEELERTGGLAPGNNITLMAPSRQGKTPLLQTTVRKKSVVQEGLYANTAIAVLDVDVSSLLLADQRAHMRLQTRLPVEVRLGDEPPLSCMMADFSERSVRLHADAGWPAGMRAGRHLSVAFRLPDHNRDTVLRGDIFRKDDTDLVLMLEEIQREGQFVRLEVIDVLEIKAKLLQLPDTSV